ncbi:acyl-CoA dehydrogenase family protein [Alloalcanivorax marinus]|uniref:acyl-CoA dehydrogenase family protein n=1 Tax=Alloalcanivorax marinus TaxID=1177169 RepID=UPI00193250B4|nr:acyl-CoA dehydrogenase family protein [Alloalcanivorax marinus]MBL7249376.1 acyl-CoA dehydrogenase family protein [Alloalcanivorax marinus]
MIRDQEVLNQLVDTIGRFVRDRLIPAEQTVAENDAIPEDIANEMKEMGLFGLSIPEEYGGLGLTMEEEALVAFEIGHTSPAFRSLFGTNNGIGAQGILIDGTEEQKRKYVPKLATGEVIGSFCLTEPDVGSDAASLKTRADKDGEHYVLNGTKRYITNGPEAGLYTVMARTDPDNKGAGGITAFIVEGDNPGLIRGKPDVKMGQKGAHVCDITFDNCRVPAENIIGGKEGQGFKTAMKVLDRGRLHISAVCVGVAERLIEDALKYAMERKQFGQPLADHQLIQAMLADSRAEAFAGRSMVLEAARSKDAGKNVSLDASCCKLFCAEMVGRVADRAVQIHGGAGYMAEYAVERFYRDVRLFRIYEGTTQIQQIVIARGMVRDAQ